MFISCLYSRWYDTGEKTMLFSGKYFLFSPMQKLWRKKKAFPLLTQCHRENVMFTVLLYEMNLHMDGGSTSTRPPKSQLIVYMSLPDFLLPSVFRIYFFSNAIKINHVIIIDLKIISVIDFINSTIRKNQMPKPRKGKEVR